MVHINYPYFNVLSLKTAISSTMKIFGYTKRQLALLKRLSCIKKYLTLIFRFKSELGHLFFKINILCPEQNFYFISSIRTVISLRVKFPMLERNPNDELCKSFASTYKLSILPAFFILFLSHDIC